MNNPSHLLMLFCLAALGLLLTALWQSSAGSAQRSESALAGAVLVAALLLVTLPPALSVWTKGPGWPTYAAAWPETANSMQKYLGYAVLILEAASLISMLGARGHRRSLGGAGVLLLGWQGVWLLSTASQGQQISLFLFLLPALAVVLLKSRISRDKVFSFFLVGALAVCGGSLAAGLVFPEQFTVSPNRTFGALFPGRLVGLIDDPNLLGAVASVLIIGAVYRWRGWARLGAVLAGVATIAFADSRSAFVACLASAAAGMLRWVLARHKGSRPAPPWRAIVLGAGAVGLVVMLNSYLGSQTDLSTLDGRRQIWDSLVSSVAGSRLIGLGAAAFTSLQSEGVVGSSIGSGHNAWIDTYVHAGTLGLAMMLMIQFTLGVKAFRAVRVDNGLSFALFVLLMMRSVSEPQITTGYLAWNSLITVLLIVMVPDTPSRGSSALPGGVEDRHAREVAALLDRADLRNFAESKGSPR